MKWLGVGEGDGIIKVEMDRGPHRSQDDAAVGYVFQRPPDPEFPSFGPKQMRWAHGDDSIIDNHDKWKYPVVNNKVNTTPPNSMSYIGQSTAMPGLYDMGQNKSIPPEHLVYMPNQMPGAGVAIHHQQYLPQSLAQQLHQPMRHQQQFPETESDWLKVASTFEQWNFPHCLGAIDGKHVGIVPPPNTGSFYYNYKGFNSLVLLAIANGNYEFIMCDFGTNGRVSDGGVIENTVFYDKLKSCFLNLPKPSPLYEGGREVPHVFIGDEAFALRPDFIKPFPQRDLARERRICNYRLSRARRVIENVFGILVARFGVFHSPLCLKLENIEKVVIACCVLHNFLRFRSSALNSCTYIQADDVDNDNFDDGCTQPGLRATHNNDSVANLQRGANRRTSPDAIASRDAFLQYFNNEGSVPWQDKMCGL